MSLPVPSSCGNGVLEAYEACEPSLEYEEGCPDGWGVCYQCRADCRWVLRDARPNGFQEGVDRSLEATINAPAALYSATAPTRITHYKEDFWGDTTDCTHEFEVDGYARPVYERIDCHYAYQDGGASQYSLETTVLYDERGFPVQSIPHAPQSRITFREYDDQGRLARQYLSSPSGACSYDEFGDQFMDMCDNPYEVCPSTTERRFSYRPAGRVVKEEDCSGDGIFESRWEFEPVPNFERDRFFFYPVQTEHITERETIVRTLAGEYEPSAWSIGSTWENEEWRWSIEFGPDERVLRSWRERDGELVEEIAYQYDDAQWRYWLDHAPMQRLRD